MSAGTKTDCGLNIGLLLLKSHPFCNRCQSVTSDLAHSFWSCSKLDTYWKKYFGKRWEPYPLIAILGVTSSSSRANKHDKKKQKKPAVLFGLVIGKKVNPACVENGS